MATRTPGPSSDYAAAFVRGLTTDQALMHIFDEPSDIFLQAAAGSERDELDLGVYWVHAGERHTWPVRVFQIDAHSAYGTESRCVWVYLDPRNVLGTPLVFVQPTAQINAEQQDGHPKAMGLTPTRPPSAPAAFAGVPTS